jgi:hypothetical protein
LSTAIDHHDPQTAARSVARPTITAPRGRACSSPRTSSPAKTCLNYVSSATQKQITRCVDDLEETGGRAEVALKGIPGVDTKLSNAVLHAHSELTELKRELH